MTKINKITEQVNIKSKDIDNKKVIEILSIINEEDSSISKSVNQALQDISVYINKAIEFSTNELILFSDDDGIFNPGTVDMHYKVLKKYPFSAGGIIRNKFLKRISKSILQGKHNIRLYIFCEISEYISGL